MTIVTIKKDIRARFLQVRDQGSRPTCLAFAVSDAHAAERSPFRSLSADYLYYHALRRMPRNYGDNGIGLTEAADALRDDGQPFETSWPYTSTLPADFTKWKPPGNLPVLFAIANSNSADPDAICSLLDKGQSSVLVFLPSERFYHADAAGFLPTRSPDPDLPQRHAVVAVGHGLAPTGRHILVRNSWGEGWGQHGHAWLAEDYLAPRLSSTTLIQLN